ncbi:MAG TPA: RHS repeat-associated core domain-containing protein [Azospirillaceae bacterium]|nr:RHS repeat-associated core domain-containing protein [Azospirillaceae bacterium]
MGADLFWCDPRRNWVKVYRLPNDADLSTVVNRAPNYIAYQKRGMKQTCVLFLKDGGVWGDPESLPSGEQIAMSDADGGNTLAGPNWLFTYTSDSLAKATRLILYRVLEQSAREVNTLPVVSALDIDDGYNTVTTTYTYDQTGACCDGTGTVAQFAKVRDKTGPGATETYFFNGLRPDAPGTHYPLDDAFTNVRDFFSMVNGQIYRTVTLDPADQPISTSTASQYVWNRNPDGKMLFGAYVRLRRKEDQARAHLFDLDPALRSTLDAAKLSPALASAFAAKGLALGPNARVGVSRPGVAWVIEDPAAPRSFPVLWDGRSLSANGFITSAVENEYNAKGQICVNRSINLDARGQETVLERRSRYAWEFYPNMATANQLAAIAESRQVSRDPQGLTTVDSIDVTTYRAWTSGTVPTWAKEKKYRWTGLPGTEVFDFKSWSADGEPPKGWLRIEKIATVNARGLPTQAIDVDGKYSTMLYDRSGGRGIGTFPAAASEACYQGFESYEASDPWSGYPSAVSLESLIWSEEAFTGDRCVRIVGSPGDKRGITASFTPARTDQSYVLSFWARYDGATAAGIDLTVTPPAGQGGGAVRTTLPIASTQGEWRQFWFLLDPAAYGGQGIGAITFAFFNQAAGSALLLDDIFFVPLLGGGKAVVYDTFSGNTVADMDNAGNIRRTAWDSYFRPAVQVGAGGAPTAVVTEYQWRNRRKDFDPTDPNAVFGIAVQGGGTWDDFHHGDCWTRRWSATGDWALADRRLVHASNGSATLTLTDAPTAADSGLRIRLADGTEPTAALGVRIGSAVELRHADGVWSMVDLRTGRSVASFAQSSMSRDWIVTVRDRKIMVWLDGQYALGHRFDAPVAGAPTLFTGGPLTVEFIATFHTAGVSIQYNDNVGALLQNQAMNDATLAVDQPVRDTLSRPVVKTKAATFADALFGYRPRFVASLDWETGVMTGEVADAHPEDQGYPYGRQVLEDTPLQRALEEGGPGKAFAIVAGTSDGDDHNGHTTRSIHGALVHDGSLDDLPAGRYVVTGYRDADDVRHADVLDLAGNTVASIIGDPTGGPGNYALTRTYYDGAGRPVRTELPNYFDKTVPGNERFVVLRTYDGLHRMVRLDEPDADGPQLFVYDRAGRKRFAQDAAGAAAGYILYWIYDALGRPMEEGSCDIAWNRDQLEAGADDLDWLPVPGNWRVRRRYDGDGRDPAAAGRLTRIVTNDGQVPDREDVATDFFYDVSGRVIRRRDRYAAGNATITTAYTYDAGGNCLTIDYAGTGDGPRVLYTYDGGGRVTSIATRDKADTAPQALAAYAYNADGLLHGERVWPDTACELATERTFMPTGWVKSQSSRLFREDLAYTENGYGDEGWYTGKIARSDSSFPGLSQPSFIASSSYRFDYDGLGRLTVAENSAGRQYGLGTTRPLSYDPSGNRLDGSVGEVDLPFRYATGSDRVLTAGDAPFRYDPMGDVSAAPASTITSLKYDRVSRLALSIGLASGDETRIQYDGSDQPVVHVTRQQVRMAFLDGLGRTLIEQVKDVGGSSSVSYLVPGPSGTVAILRDGRTFVPIRDHVGSVRGIAEEGALVAAFNYTPFGSPLGSDWIADGVPEVTNRRFAGQILDPATGCYLFPARIYDPRLGRFYQIDPARQFASPYLYGGNDPVGMIDPSGRFSWGSILAIGLGVLAVVAGVALTIATFGTGTALGAAVAAGGFSLSAMVAGAATSALIGAGIASTVYGATHTNNFKWSGWGAMVGIGAVFGAITGGAGVAVGGFSAGAGILVDTAIGAIDGLVTNGVSNVMEKGKFFDNVFLSVGLGALMGSASGLAGRWTWVKNKMLLNPSQSGGRVRIKIDRPARNNGGFGHARYEAIADGASPKIKTAHMTGDKTHGGIIAIMPQQLHSGWSAELPAANAASIVEKIERQWAQGRGGLNYGYVTGHNCTSCAIDAIKSGGVAVPFWVRTPKMLEWWAARNGFTAFDAAV